MAQALTLTEATFTGRFKQENYFDDKSKLQLALITWLEKDDNADG